MKKMDLYVSIVFYLHYDYQCVHVVLYIMYSITLVYVSLGPLALCLSHIRCIQ